MSTELKTDKLTMADLNPFAQDEQLIVVDKGSTPEEVSEQEILVTDSWVFVENDQPVTTSLKIAEVFEKKHKHVLEAIENAIKTLTDAKVASGRNGPNFQPSEGGQPNFRPSENGEELGFFRATYKNDQNKDQPMYYLNRDAFSFVVMGFTGTKAAKWKWAYIQAFNKMEKQLRDLKKTDNTPKTTVEMFKMAADIFSEHEKKLNDHNKRISVLEEELSGNALSDLTATTLKQEERLNDLDEQIFFLNREILGLSRRDLTDDIKMVVSQVVKSKNITYQDAYRLFYEAVSMTADRPAYYIASLVTRQRNKMITQGRSKTYVQQKVTGISVINADDSLRKAAESIIVSMSEKLLRE